MSGREVFEEYWYVVLEEWCRAACLADQDWDLAMGSKSWLLDEVSLSWIGFSVGFSVEA